ncbi:MAG: CPBP family intramembrane metalloprotease [Candidatus Cloacimonetes bacterium]|nr:CPBP family intramembrane metalloprotease [Candidatus Cloacimonadota bacterium]
MINLRKITVIYRKEMLDLLRDKRTVITSIVIPIILYPLLMVGFSSLAMRQETKLEKQVVHVYLVDHVKSETSVRIIGGISAIDNLEFMPFSDSIDVLLRENLIQAAVQISDSLNASGFPVIIVTISYNETEDLSVQAYDRISNRLRELEDELVSERLKDLMIEVDILDAVQIKKENIAPPEQMVGFMVGKILPYLLIVITLSSGAVVASDLVAGEKERGTLETILVSAARRIELVIGKYLTIITFSLISVFMNLFSMFLSIRHILGQSGLDTGGIQLPISNFALILAAMLPLVTLIAAVLLSLSTYARNIKEAQSYQMPIIIGGMMLSMISLLPGFKLTAGFALIPVVNFSLLFKEIMSGNFQILSFSLVLGSTLILDIIAIIISMNLFRNESILFRTAEDKSLKFWGQSRKNVLSPEVAFLFFLIMIVLLFYVGGSWQAKEMMSGLVRTQLILILLPTIFLLRIARMNIRATLKLNPTNPLNFLMVVLMAVPMITLVVLLGQFINMIYPVSESYMEGMRNLLSTEQAGIWKSLLIIAVLPGICEETMFRGYIINAFRKYGFWAAAVISGVLFGIFHLDFFRLIPASILGIYLGYLLLKSNSLLIPMFAHFINNSIALLLSNYHEKIKILDYLMTGDEFVWWIGIPALIIFLVFLKLYTRINRNPDLN